MIKKLYKYIASFVIVGLLILVMPKTAEAAIAFDSVTDSGANINSFSHTTTGSNLLLVVTAQYNDGNESITGITYNSVALTKVRRDTTGAPVDITTEIWYLIAPASGANTVAVTYTANPTQRRHVSPSFTGAAQSSVLDAQNG